MLEHLWDTMVLQTHPCRAAIRRVLEAALRAVMPTSLLSAQVSCADGVLRVANTTYHIQEFNRIILLALGKAALSMAEAWLDLPDMPVPEAGLVVCKHSTTALRAENLIIRQGGHPLPDERSLQAGQAIERLLMGLRPDDLVVCLVSGGGSALVTLPPEGVSLSDLRELTEALFRSGATIAEVNMVRRHLDRLKGGGLAKLAFPAQVLTLILSDVPGNAPEAVASGPTVPDPTTVQDARRVLERYDLHATLPPSLLDSLLETPKPDDEIFTNVRNVVIGSNMDTLQAALRQACLEGFHSFLLRRDVQGEAREVAVDLCRALRRVHAAGEPVPRPACLVAGGETTVTLGDASGRGGRNQEFALAAVRELADLPDVMLIALATDGEDGPTDSAGAVVTGGSARRASALGLDVSDALQRHDSYTFFAALGDGIRIGPTGTNVNDLFLFFAF